MQVGGYDYTQCTEQETNKDKSYKCILYCLGVYIGSILLRLHPNRSLQQMLKC